MVPPPLAEAGRTQVDREQPPSCTNAPEHKLDLSACGNESLKRQTSSSSSPSPSSSQVASAAPLRPTPAKYDTFGETTRIDTATLLSHLDDLPHWFRIHGFDDEVCDKLNLNPTPASLPVPSPTDPPPPDSETNRRTTTAITIDTLEKMTKQDLKRLIGLKDGIRLFNLLREVESARRSGVQRHSSVSRMRMTPDSCLPDVRLSSTPTLTRELFPAGLHGYCFEVDCSLSAPSQCSQRTCQRPLCIAHQTKSLLTGNILCQECYQKMTYLEGIQDSIGITSLKEQGYAVPQCAIQ